MPAPTIRLTAAVAATMLAASALAACSSSHKPAPDITPSNHPAAAPRTSTLEFVGTDEPGNMTLEDLGAKSAPGGPDLGDLLAFTQTLTRNGKPAGHVHVIAVGVDHKRHLSEATGTIVLTNGTLQLAGIVTMNPTFTLTITGGTGAYTADTGTLDFNANGPAQKITVHLTGPASS